MNKVWRIAALAVLLATAGFLPPVGSAVGDPTPVRILTIGDSITATGGWQAQTAALLNQAGVEYKIYNAAVPGTRCSYWPERIAALLDQYNPDLVVLACGTNDDPSELMWGESRTGWSIRYVIEAVYAHGGKTLPALIQYADPLSAPSWLLLNQPRTNDNLYPSIMAYAIGAQIAGILNLQTIPSTADYLHPDGIHPDGKGYPTIGRHVYDSAAGVMGWPDLSMPSPCGMYGHRLGVARPAYTPCD